MKNRNDNKIKISGKTIKKKNGMVILPVKKWEMIEKENFELKSALKAILSGELALRAGKTRSFKDFLKSKFPLYAENN